MSVAVQYKILNNAPTATSKFGDSTERGVNTASGHVAAINAPKARRSGFTFAGVEHGCGVHVPRARVARLRQTEASPRRYQQFRW